MSDVQSRKPETACRSVHSEDHSEARQQMFSSLVKSFTTAKTPHKLFALSGGSFKEEAPMGVDSTLLSDAGLPIRRSSAPLHTQLSDSVIVMLQHCRDVGVTRVPGCGVR